MLNDALQLFNGRKMRPLLEAGVIGRFHRHVECLEIVATVIGERNRRRIGIGVLRDEVAPAEGWLNRACTHKLARSSQLPECLLLPKADIRGTRQKCQPLARDDASTLRLANADQARRLEEYSDISQLLRKGVCSTALKSATP